MAELILDYDTEGRLCLVDEAANHGPIYVDFVAGAGAHRRKFGGGLQQPLARACGLSGKFKPQLCDANAGMGRDSLVLASLGAPVTLLERHPQVAALLRDGLRRLAQCGQLDPELQPLAQLMTLLEVDAIEYLSSAAARCDVVYLDPMFPPRQKSAKVKKEMAAFHRLVGRDEDAAELLQAALAAARYRVVVKRPRGADWLAARKPSHAIEGKTVRYDIYVNSAIPK